MNCILEEGGNSKMKLMGTEVQFESQASIFWLEKSGYKNHIERYLSIEEEKWLREHDVVRIRISNKEDPSNNLFIREITNIFKEGEILGQCLYSFTWKQGEVRSEGKNIDDGT